MAGDPVQTFRTISWLVFKWLLIAAAVVVALAALAVGGYFALQWYNYDRHAATVAIVIDVNDAMCTKGDFPLAVIVKNGSGKTINRVSFSIAARKKGYSSDIAQYQSYSDDKIILPGRSWANCWKTPTLKELVLDLKSLDWSLDSVRYTFAD